MYSKMKFVFCLCVLSAFLLTGVAYAENGTTDNTVLTKKPEKNGTVLEAGKTKLPTISPNRSNAKMPPDDFGTHRSRPPDPLEKKKMTPSDNAHQTIPVAKDNKHPQ